MKIITTNTLYDPKEVNVGIVHIGLGAFHRAHQAVYVEKNLNRHRGGEWGICAVNIRSNRKLVDQLQEQGCQYHVAEYSDSQNAHLREVSAIRQAVFAGEDKSVLFEKLLSPDTKIVMLTVTEKGYYLTPSEKKLRCDDPDIQHDIENPTTPKTTPGILVEALRQRKEQGFAPFTVLSCDNMPNNGCIIRQAVYELSLRQSKALAEWILDHVAFPCSMVDRIVPAMSDESRARLSKELNCDDPNAVMCESFSQWVVEDDFPQGRPDWELDGVQMVKDVHPFETMKLRLLNGSHSLLAYIGLAANYKTVAEAVADPTFVNFIRHYMTCEASPTLKMPVEVDVEVYIDRLIERFSNDSLKHQLSQIAMDGSQKIPQRWFTVAERKLAANLDVSLISLGVAAWVLYTRGKSVSGETYSVDDPMAAQLQAVHKDNQTAESLIKHILALEEIFPRSLGQNPVFIRAVIEAYSTLISRDVESCLRLFHHNTIQSGE